MTAPAARRGMVLDVETRIDRKALQASGRNTSPRGMPPGLQVIVAAALLDFDIAEDGSCGAFRLRSADCAASGERTLVRMLDGELARLRGDGGTLVSFNGGHDLSMVRLAMLRHRGFGRGGAAAWLADGSSHSDLMLLLGDTGGRFPALSDLSAAFAIHAPGAVAVGAPVVTAEVAKCETDVVSTMAVYMHLLSEAAGSDRPLRSGVPPLAEMIRLRLDRSPHLRSMLDGRLFRELAAD